VQVQEQSEQQPRKYDNSKENTTTEMESNFTIKDEGGNDDDGEEEEDDDEKEAGKPSNKQQLYDLAEVEIDGSIIENQDDTEEGNVSIDSIEVAEIFGQLDSSLKAHTQQPSPLQVGQHPTHTNICSAALGSGTFEVKQPIAQHSDRLPQQLPPRSNSSICHNPQQNEKTEELTTLINSSMLLHNLPEDNAMSCTPNTISLPSPHGLNYFKPLSQLVNSSFTCSPSIQNPSSSEIRSVRKLAASLRKEKRVHDAKRKRRLSGIGIYHNIYDHKKSAFSSSPSPAETRLNLDMAPVKKNSTSKTLKKTGVKSIGNIEKHAVINYDVDRKSAIGRGLSPVMHIESDSTSTFGNVTKVMNSSLLENDDSLVAQTNMSIMDFSQMRSEASNTPVVESQNTRDISVTSCPTSTTKSSRPQSKPTSPKEGGNIFLQKDTSTIKGKPHNLSSFPSSPTRPHSGFNKDKIAISHKNLQFSPSPATASKPMLLDSAARNTRSAKKRKSAMFSAEGAFETKKKKDRNELLCKSGISSHDHSLERRNLSTSKYSEMDVQKQVGVDYRNRLTIEEPMSKDLQVNLLTSVGSNCAKSLKETVEIDRASIDKFSLEVNNLKAKTASNRLHSKSKYLLNSSISIESEDTEMILGYLVKADPTRIIDSSNSINISLEVPNGSLNGQNDDNLVEKGQSSSCSSGGETEKYCKGLVGFGSFSPAASVLTSESETEKLSSTLESRSSIGSHSSKQKLETETGDSSVNGSIITKHHTSISGSLAASILPSESGTESLSSMLRSRNLIESHSSKPELGVETADSLVIDDHTTSNAAYDSLNSFIQGCISVASPRSEVVHSRSLAEPPTMQRTVTTGSPLSRSSRLEDTFSICPSSEESNENMSASRGSIGIEDDGADTVNTNVLHNIMAAFNNESVKIPTDIRQVPKQKSNNRGSVLSSLTTDTDSLKGATEQITANTEDLKGLLSFNSIFSSKGATQTSNKVLPKKLKDGEEDIITTNDKIAYSMDEGLADSPNSKKKTSTPNPSEIATPKSILNSSWKRRFIEKGVNLGASMKKTVEFEAPEAAEYNIGSPPMSLTPMCSKRVKELYSVPKRKVFAECESSEISEEEPITMQIIDGSIQSEEELRNNSTLELIKNMDATAELRSSSFISAGMGDEASSLLLGSYENTRTVELESNVSALIKQARESPLSLNKSPYKSPTPEKVHLNNLKGIEYLRNNPNEDTMSSLHLDSKRLDFGKPHDDITDSSFIDQSEQNVERTIELEPNIEMLMCSPSHSTDSKAPTFNTKGLETCGAKILTQEKMCNNSKPIELENEISAFLANTEVMITSPTDDYRAESSNKSSLNCLEGAGCLQSVSDRIKMKPGCFGGRIQDANTIGMKSEDFSSGNQSGSSKECTVELEGDLLMLVNNPIVDASSATEASTIYGSEVAEVKVTSPTNADLNKGTHTMELEDNVNVLLKNTDIINALADNSLNSVPEISNKNMINFSEIRDGSGLSSMQRYDHSKKKMGNLDSEITLTSTDRLINNPIVGANSGIRAYTINDSESVKILDATDSTNTEQDIGTQTIELENNVNIVLKNTENENIPFGNSAKSIPDTSNMNLNDFSEITDESGLSSIQRNYYGTNETGHLESEMTDPISIHRLGQNAGCTIELESNVAMLVNNPAVGVYRIGRHLDSNEDPSEITGRQSRLNNEEISGIGCNTTMPENSTIDISHLELNTERNASIPDNTEASQMDITELTQYGNEVSSPRSEEIKVDKISYVHNATSNVLLDRCDDQTEVDVTWKEISNFVNFDTSGDLVSAFLIKEAGNAIAEYNHPPVVKRINEFISNACEEMEQNIDEDDLKLESHLASIVQTSRTPMLNLQETLRKSDGNQLKSEVKATLQALGNAAEGYCARELEQWEMQVVTALSGSVADLLFNMADEENNIERYIKLADDTLKSLSIISQHSVKKARRRSIYKRKCSVSALEGTIKELELSVQKADLGLYSKRCERESLFRTSDVLAVNNLEQSNVRKKRALADSNLDRLRSVEGLHSWKLVSLQKSNISLFFNLNHIGISIVAHFSSTNLGSVVCNARLPSDSDLPASSKPLSNHYLFPSSVNEYFRFRAGDVCREINRLPLSSPSEISHTVHYLEWYMGRVEISGKELSKVIYRYKGILQQSNAKSFQLSIQFFNLGGNTQKIKARFEIGDAYPFAPLPVEFEGDVDVKLLRRQLLKSCKPGFGYLSRMCDTISAWIP